MAPKPEPVHATAIAVSGRAAIIRGPSASGKSDLALRCLAVAPSGIIPECARLVGDDQILVEAHGEKLFVRPHPNLAGLIEVRGIGIVRVAGTSEEAAAHVLVDLVAEREIDRLPDPWPFETISGVALPVLKVAAFAPSTPLKVMLALCNPTFPNWA